MPCGAHHHLKRLAAPTQWGLDKKNGKYAVRPLPGPHNKDISIPLKYIIARFLKVANTSKEVDYIAESGMIHVNGKEVKCPKSPIGLFDVITIVKTNQHYRLYLGANKKFKLHKITSDEAKIRISKVISKHINEDIPLTHTLDGYNFKFADPSINIEDTVKIDISSNKIVSSISLSVGKTAYVYCGPNSGRIGIIKRIDVAENGKKTVFVQDKLGKSFNVLSSKLMVIGENDNCLVSFDEDDGIRLNAFEISNKKYNSAEKVEVEDN